MDKPRKKGQKKDKPDKNDLSRASQNMGEDLCWAEVLGGKIAEI